jgi:hypothetical protein
MRCYCITCETHSTTEHRLVAALQVFEDRINALPGVWLMSTSWTVEEIDAHLRRHLGEGDALGVHEAAVGSDWGGWMRPEVEKWLRRHLGERT